MAGASAAIDFCTSVFGASVVTRNDLPNGKVAHAELQLESSRLQLSDPTRTTTSSPGGGRQPRPGTAARRCVAGRAGGRPDGMIGGCNAPDPR